MTHNIRTDRLGLINCNTFVLNIIINVMLMLKELIPEVVALGQSSLLSNI